jgi:hypothetical protein
MESERCSVEVKLDARQVPIETLKPNPWNPNKQSDFVFEKELNSIRQFGFVVPIIVREASKGKYEIIDGEHRWKAAKELGMTQVPINSLGKVETAAAKKLTIILNELHGQYDVVDLAKLVAGLNKEVGLDELVRDLPFETQELENLIATATFDMDSLKKPDKGDDAGDDDQWKELKFIVSVAQAEIIDGAIKRIVDGIPLAMKNPQAQALELICADSMNTPLESLK